MSIIGEMYEEQIWESNSELKKRMEEFLAFCTRTQYGSFEAMATFCVVKEKFRELFDKELKWNNGTPGAS